MTTLTSNSNDQQETCEEYGTKRRRGELYPKQEEHGYAAVFSLTVSFSYNESPVRPVPRDLVVAIIYC